MRFTVWSPFDGKPLPVPNEVERDILLAQGYLAEPPASELATGGIGTGSPLLVGESGPELVPATQETEPSDER